MRIRHFHLLAVLPTKRTHDCSREVCTNSQRSIRLRRASITASGLDINWLVRLHFANTKRTRGDDDLYGFVMSRLVWLRIYFMYRRWFNFRTAIFDRVFLRSQGSPGQRHSAGAKSLWTVQVCTLRPIFISFCPYILLFYANIICFIFSARLFIIV